MTNRKNKVMACTVGVLSLMLALAAGLHSQTPLRWSTEQANDWYAKQPWIVGSNFIPSDAINQFEMFQAETWNPQLNDKELGLAEDIGMNTMRVFLQDQLWNQDPKGLTKRLDQFLTIAAKRHIRVLFVLFDSCWDPFPKLGPQHPPVPGIHNSGWVQSPGANELTDPAYESKLEAYVKGVVGAFANDDRVLGWDLWNEPDNRNEGSYGRLEPRDKVQRVDSLLPKVFAWAREVHPIQPITSGLWQGNWSDPAKMSETSRIQIEESDIITFHNYGWPEQFEAGIKELQKYGRPIICSEYMARGAGSTFDNSLPIAKNYHVGAINWGLVAGRTQTYLPWDSWRHPYITSEPVVWFHDVFRQDGTPYRQHEADEIRQLTGRSQATLEQPLPSH
jgi:hypothetical protein